MNKSNTFRQRSILGLAALALACALGTAPVTGTKAIIMKMARK